MTGKGVVSEGLFRLGVGIGIHPPHVVPSLVSGSELRLSPSQYLDSLCSPGSPPPPPGVSVVVVGDLWVLGAWSGGEPIALPRATVLGSVILRGLASLREVNLVCRGNLRVEECPSPFFLRGEVAQSACLVRCGIVSLGADFAVMGDLSVSACHSLVSMNCSVAGDFSASSCRTLSSTGPAFSVARTARFSRCPLLAAIRGSVGGLVRGEAVGNPTTSPSATADGSSCCRDLESMR